MRVAHPASECGTESLLYHQLKQALLSDMEQGVYKPGERLPSEPED